VYVVTPDLTGKMQATVTGQFDSAVYVRSDCVSIGSTDLLGCVDKLDGNSTETLTVPVVSGSSYWVFVDAPTSTQAGVFELAIEVTAAVCGDAVLDGGEGCDDGNAAAGDGCDAACQLEPVGTNDVCPGQAITLVDDGNGSYSAQISSGNTNLSSTSNITLTGCTSSGRDAIYAVVAPIDGVLIASVPTAAFNTSLGAQTICGTSTSLVVCSNANTGTGGEEIAFTVAAGTTYYLVVDSTSSTNAVGPFQLSVLVTPPGCGDGLVSTGEACDDGNLLTGDGCDASCVLEPLSGNDTCPGYVVTLAGSGTDPRTASVTTDTTPLGAHYGGSCGGSARDAVYAVTPDVGGTLTAKLTAGFDTVLYARTVCLDAGTEAECDDILTAGATSISFSVLANEQYFLFVDGFSGAFGVSTLDITVTP
jgi:cysteine-rich repeat protein